MKRFIPILLCAAAILCGCEKKYESVEPTHTASFGYEIVRKPFTVEFKSQSVYQMSHYWEFGDGTSSKLDRPWHTYTKAGTYTVTHTGTESDGKQYTAYERITLKDPDVYIKSYTIHDIPYEKKYYQVHISNGSDWSRKVIYSPLLRTPDLPYSYYLNNPILMDNLKYDSYYWVSVNYNSSTSGNGTQCLKKKITTDEIKQYKGVASFIDGNMSITISFDYQ